MFLARYGAKQRERLLADAGIVRSKAKIDAAMTREANKEAVRRYMDELWSQGDLSVADQVVAEDFVSHRDPRPLAGPWTIRLL